MATNRTTPVQPAEAPERTPEQAVNDGIVRVVKAHGIDIQKARYKAMRAIAWQAFIESIEAGDFDKLVERASANVAKLPAGWEIEAPSKAKAAPVKKAPARKATR